MVIIRKTQLSAIRESNFRRSLRDFVRKVWPSECQRLGNKDVESRIQACLDKAKIYEITDQGDIRRFINLMFILDDKDFDTSQDTQWASKILSWKDATSELKLSALERRAEIDQIEKMKANVSREA